MTHVCGGFSSFEAADDEIKALCESVKPQVEAKMNSTYDTYEPVSYKSQVVAGTNYEIIINVGQESHLIIRVWKKLPCYGGECEVTEAKFEQ